VAKRLDADVCSVYLTEADLRHMVLAATMGLDKNAVGHVRRAFGAGLVGPVAAAGRPMALDDAQSHPAYRYFPETGEERYASLMAAPLIVRGLSRLAGLSTMGVLVVQTRERREFDDVDLGMLETCAQLMAPVVMNSQLLALVAGSDESRARVVEELGRAGVGLPGEEPARAERNVRVQGIATSRGIALGQVYFLGDAIDLDTVDYRPSEDPEQELRDLHDALMDARRELHDLREDVAERFGADFSAVFNTHIQILEDKGFLSKLDHQTRETGSALLGVRNVLREYAQMFASIEDPFFRERGVDVQDVGQRIVARLLGVRHSTQPLADGAVVMASNLLPAHFATLETERISAIVSEHGGPTSHGAIFARALEIPAVTGAAGILELARAGEPCIVDGETGSVFLSPDHALRREYELAQHRNLAAVEHLDALAERPAETRDGRRVALTANVGLIPDLRLCERHGAEGIGLFRTELLALVHRGFPTENEQEQLYREVAQAMTPRPVTIRTLDLGGDKAIPNLGLGHEENPQLGWRSIRLSLSHEEHFRAQLRAILRASLHRNLRLLLPMISSVDELRRVRVILDEEREELAGRGVGFDATLPVGVMIEVPSAAMIADALARECDFFSIGTNDLTQYTLAVDRGNERVAHLYDPLHPAVLGLVDRTVRAARRHGIPVSICGEMASNPLAVPLLVGLGIEELSGVASSVPVIKEIVRALDTGEVEADVRLALVAASAGEVHRIAAERLRRQGLLAHRDIGDWLTRAVDRVLANGSARS
ncbi:MAG: phosphoenolpyruvate--protein phosphotransferase, partial [Myxococcota bacterium]|nr:phosphoenolpyruvate--protein phosphotransferase [Myxococcota bacterium]